MMGKRRVDWKADRWVANLEKKKDNQKVGWLVFRWAELLAVVSVFLMVELMVASKVESLEDSWAVQMGD